MTSKRTVLVIGASGYLGRVICGLLMRKGARVLGLARNRSRLDALMTNAPSDQWIGISFDLKRLSTDPESLDHVLSRVDAVIYCAGEVFAKNKQHIDCLYHRWPAILAQRAAKLGIQNFILISASGVTDRIKSPYREAKCKGEEAVCQHVPAWVICPNVVFGAGGGLIAMYEKMARLSPILLLPAYGRTKFAPVHTGDIAAICEVLINQAAGGRLDVSGTEQLSLKEIIHLMLKAKRQRRLVLGLPSLLFWPLALVNDIFGLHFITRDQLRLIQRDLLPPNDHKSAFDVCSITPRRLSSFFLID